MTRSLLTLLLLLGPLIVQAQNYLDGYIQEGLQNNQSIERQNLQLEKAIYALREAKAMYLPSVTFMTDYFLADGGRTIDFPAGDLLNPVYGTLNQMTQSDNFPQIDNVSEQLNPHNFYDARFRVSMPLINAEIEYNKRIKDKQTSLQKIEIDLYKRELVKDIKAAYYNYQKASEAITIYETALTLTIENKRINESLFENGKVNRTAVVRANNELIGLQAQLAKARLQARTAQAYFNFLLNKDQNATILTDSVKVIPALYRVDTLGVASREELKKLSVASDINSDVIKLKKAFIIPQLNTFLDVGSQGFDFEFDNQSRYYLFGLSLQWELFAGNRNKYQIRQSELDQQLTKLQTDEAADQLELQLTQAINNLNAAYQEYAAASRRFDSAEQLYQDFVTLYKEGSVLYIELLDAQNQLITAELQQNIARYDFLVYTAELERATSSYNLNN